jgi:ADP-ribose diphosphatase
MLPKPWKTLSTREAYRNKWIRVREDMAELPNGRTTLYGVCEIGHAVGILPFVDDEHVVMVRQYRYIQKENRRWEMPTGGALPGETLEEAAQRELMEEIGYRAGQLEFVNTHYTSKSVCDETAHIFIGRILSPAPSRPDETEFLQVATFAFDEVLQMVLRSEIRDAMTVIGVLFAAQRRNYRDT